MGGASWVSLLSPAQDTTSVPPTVSGITEKPLLQHFVPFPFSPLENKREPAGSDLPPPHRQPRHLPGARGPLCLLPGLAENPQEEGPCELGVAMAMEPWNLTTGAQEWGWGVGTGHAGGREEGP